MSLIEPKHWGLGRMLKPLRQNLACPTLVRLMSYRAEGHLHKAPNQLGKVSPRGGQRNAHNMSLLERCPYISNLKCTKLIRVEYSVPKEIRVNFDH